ncbi:hypothetical protein TSOC_007708 [Tetrabaena socialis]|uniref:Uncharacterized protein n=1 Tax=Tetrabaena socialis TaxID=47790 RepID=A0A2J8A0D0_9CHLO|nr:hypothetical protein TSOC_007708 [Tetrabaena socialis]|eukprot:PNH05965.1 hypothetical protein TSOC_007708 [Tetrabaena socialis]
MKTLALQPVSITAKANEAGKAAAAERHSGVSWSEGRFQPHVMDVEQATHRQRPREPERLPRQVGLPGHHAVRHGDAEAGDAHGGERGPRRRAQGCVRGDGGWAVAFEPDGLLSDRRKVGVGRSATAPAVCSGGRGGSGGSRKEAMRDTGLGPDPCGTRDDKGSGQGAPAITASTSSTERGTCQQQSYHIRVVPTAGQELYYLRAAPPAGQQFYHLHVAPLAGQVQGARPALRGRRSGSTNAAGVERGGAYVKRVWGARHAPATQQPSAGLHV